MALADGLMQDAVGGAHGVRINRVRAQFIRVAHCYVPDAVQPSGRPIDAHIAPGTTLVPRADEHQETADCVGPELADEIVRVHHVSPALAHLLMVRAQDYTLVVQPQERLVIVD